MVSKLIGQSTSCREGSVFCTQCGKPSKSEYRYCSSCGAYLNEFLIFPNYNESQSQEFLSNNHIELRRNNSEPNQQSIGFKALEEVKNKKGVASVKNIIGLIFGIISLLYLPLFVLQSSIAYCCLGIVAIITICGLAISAFSVQDHAIIGIVGLVLNATSCLIQNVLAFILLIYCYL